ncbi:YSIRK-targeted triacylglycerol lipase [Staphylococcus ratti]|uniref:YSIRK-targeted triacylglycerol lipase n=1 Tax=Staphylococcus ratti TaxID=2892440 RepID=UPI00237CE574|nr:triacylglycerol lipase [Staphylococcus ratti]
MKLKLLDKFIYLSIALLITSLITAPIGNAMTTSSGNTYGVNQSNSNNQNFYKNKAPIILVPGFNSYVDDKKPSYLAKYWGGTKYDIPQNLEKSGYRTFEADIGALSSNYERAVELYYFIKGGRVDYGAAHAKKYGHKRYGATYEGVYPEWSPEKPVHLVSHSMGGQTIRMLEHLLRYGSQEEIKYHKVHGGKASDLFRNKTDTQILSMTTLSAPHNGTYASDELGNEAFVKQCFYLYVVLKGNANSRVNFGLDQWGLRQKKGESSSDYAKRVMHSKIWKTKDHGFYDLTTEGARKINQQTNINPKIYYTSYAAEATHKNIMGKYKADYSMFFPLVLTANVIGKVSDTSWRENDGLISITSAQHPYNQPFKKAGPKQEKGIWQVMPTLHDWDHADLVGQDEVDTNRTKEELEDMYKNIAERLVQAEKSKSGEEQ